MNSNYNYSENITEIGTEKQEHKQNYRKVDPMTKDLIKEAIQKSTALYQNLEQSEFSSETKIKDFSKLVQMVSDNLRPFLDPNQEEVFHSKVAASDVAETLKKLFSKGRKSLNGMLAEDEQCTGLIYQIDYILTRLETCYMNYDKGIYEANNGELSHYWIRKLRSGFRAVLTEKLGFSLERTKIVDSGQIVEDEESEIIEDLEEFEKEEEEFSQLINPEEETKDNARVYFGESFSIGLQKRIKEIMNSQVKKLGPALLQHFLQQGQADTEKVNNKSGEKDKKKTREPKSGMNYYKGKQIMAKNFFHQSQELFSNKENILVSSSSEDSICIVGDLGLFIEFNKNEICFAQRFSNKKFLGLTDIEGDYLIYEAEESALYRKDLGSSEAPQIWLKLETIEDPKLFGQNFKYETLLNLILMIKSPNKVSCIDLNSHHSSTLDRDIHQALDPSKWFDTKLEQPEIFEHSLNIQTAALINDKTCLILDSKLDLYLVQFYLLSHQSMLLNKSSINREQNLSPSKFGFNEKKSNGLIALNDDNTGCLDSIVIFSLKNFQRIVLTRIIDYSQEMIKSVYDSIFYKAKNFPEVPISMKTSQNAERSQLSFSKKMMKKRLRNWSSTSTLKRPIEQEDRGHWAIVGVKFDSEKKEDQFCLLIEEENRMGEEVEDGFDSEIEDRVKVLGIDGKVMEGFVFAKEVKLRGAQMKNSFFCVNNRGDFIKGELF
jgi:hypothetical protein